jgi:2'-5' RNA ligase
VRVFVAIPVPDDVRRALGELIAKLRRACPQARWVRTEGMHVTLKFIGECGEDKVERIKTAIAAVRSAAPVELRFRNTGFFPNPKHPRVFWAGIDASPNLAEIAQAISSLWAFPAKRATFTRTSRSRASTRTKASLDWAKRSHSLRPLNSA